jgi:hypothetical protein
LRYFSIVFAFAGLSTITSAAPPALAAAPSSDADEERVRRVGAAAEAAVFFEEVVFLAAIVVAGTALELGLGGERLASPSSVRCFGSDEPRRRK